MTIYQSEFLNIIKTDDVFIQIWTENLLFVDDYKRELLTFMELLCQHRPKWVIVDVKKCRLVIPEELDAWMAEKILIPMSKKGIKKLAFTIAEDTAVHIAIVTSLDKAKPIIQSSYFADLNDATEHFQSIKKSKSPKFECQTNTTTDSISIDLNIDSNDLPHFINSMKQLEIDNQFAKDHSDLYNTLTFREIEIFKLIAKGYTNKQIGLASFIEESSVKTHRKNIKQKLNIVSIFDIYQYARCFKLI